MTNRNDEMQAYLDAMFPAYAECALWSTTELTADDEDDDNTFEYNGWGIEDLSLPLADAMRDDCAAFIDDNWDDLRGIDAGQAGHDFWLTREGHGTGFWDRGLGDVGERLSAAARDYGDFSFYSDIGQLVEG